MIITVVAIPEGLLLLQFQWPITHLDPTEHVSKKQTNPTLVNQLVLMAPRFIDIFYPSGDENLLNSRKHSSKVKINHFLLSLPCPKDLPPVLSSLTQDNSSCSLTAQNARVLRDHREQ